MQSTLSITSWRSWLLPLLLIEGMILLVASLNATWIVGVFTFILVAMWVLLAAEHFVYYGFLFFLPLFPILPSGARSIVIWSYVLLIIGYWYLRWISQGYLREEVPRYVKYFFGLFLVIGLFSTIDAVAVRHSALEWIRYLSLFVVFSVLYRLIRNKRQLSTVLNIAILSSVVVVLLSVKGIISHSPPDFLSGGIGLNRLSSFYENANSLAIPFLFSIPVLFCKIIYLPRQTRYRSIVRLVLVALLLIFSYVVLLTFSRSAWLSLTISMSIILATTKVGRRLLLVAIGLLLVIFTRISEYLYLALRLAKGLTGREYLWKAAVQIIRENTLLGVGPGNFEIMKTRHILPTTGLSRLMRSPEGTGAAHNLYLSMSAELGIVATGVLVVFIAIVLFKAGKMIRRTADSELRMFLIAAVSIISGLMVRAFFESGVVIGSGRLVDGINFLLPLLIIARADRIVQGEKPTIQSSP
jgi:O-antigen ligase